MILSMVERGTHCSSPLRPPPASRSPRASAPGRTPARSRRAGSRVRRPGRGGGRSCLRGVLPFFKRQLHCLVPQAVLDDLVEQERIFGGEPHLTGLTDLVPSAAGDDW